VFKKSFVSFLPGIVWKLEKDSNHESKCIVKEMERIATVVAHCAAQIVRADVIFEVMHDHVVSVIAARRESKKRGKDVRDNLFVTGWAAIGISCKYGPMRRKVKQ